MIKQWFIDAWYLLITPYKMLWEWLNNSWSKFYNWIEDIYLECKWFIQRGKRGWSDRDSWSIDWWLSKIMPSILMKLKNNKMGIPNECFSNSKSSLKKNGNATKKEWKRAEKRWNDILRSIIFMFKASRWIQENHWIYCSTKDYYKKEKKAFRKRMALLDFTYIMSYKECKLYELGWKNFQEYYFSLWD